MSLTLSVPMEHCKVLDTKFLPISGSGSSSQRRALLPFSFPRQAVECYKKWKNQVLYSAQQSHLDWCGCFEHFFFFFTKISVMVFVHKSLNRPSVSENISQLAALHSSCAFTTLLQIRSQDDGFIWAFGMGQPGFENNCYSEWKPDTGYAPFGKPVPQVSLPLPSQTMKKRGRE